MSNDHDRQADDLLDRLTAQWRQTEAPADVPEHVTASILRAVQKTETSTKERIMTMLWKTRYPSAAAAVLAVAVIGWMLLGPSTGVAFADVVQNMREVRSATFNSRTETEGQSATTGRSFYKQPGLMRVEIDAPPKAVMIWDYQQERGISLMPELKKAIPADFRGAMAQAAPPDPFAMAQVIPPGTAELIREEKVDGTATKVYRANVQGQQITFWADAKTALPVKIEMVQKPKGMPEQRTVMSDFRWNPDLDDSLFSVAVPEGYEVAQTIDFSNPSEQDLVEAMRVWTSLSDGQFPDKIDANTPQELFGLFAATKEKGPEALKKFMDLSQKVNRGLMFAIRTQQSDLDWHYAGAGVNLGEADKPVAWWRATKDAETYRVLYGNLTIRDVKPEDLPKAQPEGR